MGADRDAYRSLQLPMKTHVVFCSDAFPPYKGEEGLVNSGRYGKRLAEFLAEELKRKGFDPMTPVAEDWGWVVPIKNNGFRLWIGCSNCDRYPDDGFLCFIQPHQRRIRRWALWKVDVSARILALQEAIDQILSTNPAVCDKMWLTYEEFNVPSSRAP
jgi:hypothetical protein